MNRVVFCPVCSRSFQETKGLVVEYWKASDTIYFCWCPSCSWSGEVAAVVRVTTTEPDEDH